MLYDRIQRFNRIIPHNFVHLCPSLSVCLPVKRLSGSESSGLARQKELLLQKLETFEATNRTLRHLLREQHGSQVLCVTQLQNTVP